MSRQAGGRARLKKLARLKEIQFVWPCGAIYLSYTYVCVQLYTHRPRAHKPRAQQERRPRNKRQSTVEYFSEFNFKVRVRATVGLGPISYIPSRATARRDRNFYMTESTESLGMPRRRRSFSHVRGPSRFRWVLRFPTTVCVCREETREIRSGPLGIRLPAFCGIMCSWGGGPNAWFRYGA